MVLISLVMFWDSSSSTFTLNFLFTKSKLALSTPSISFVSSSIFAAQPAQLRPSNSSTISFILNSPFTTIKYMSTCSYV